MTEIKKFQPSTKEKPKPAAPLERASLNENEREKPADVVDIEEARNKIAKRETIPKTPLVFPDTESEELMETASGLIKKLFEDSRDKKVVVEQLRKLADELEQK